MSARSEEVSHSGKIIEITPQLITVEIVSESACSSCHAKGLCGLGESKVKTVQVPFDFGNWAIGQEVEVILKRSMGLKAVWVAYVLPLCVLFAVLMGVNATGAGELVSGLCAIGAVALYYLAIFIFRDKLRNEYSFSIKEKYD